MRSSAHANCYVAESNQPMNDKLKITTINDEISDDIGVVIEFLKSHNITLIELRTIQKRNLVDYSLDEVRDLYDLLCRNNIEVSALASPLFKWYPDAAGQESYDKVDTFHFNPHVCLEDKRNYIKKAIAVAKLLHTKYIRIFSSLRSASTEYDFTQDPLLEWALIEAKKEGITLLLENEPPCYIHKMADIKFIASEFQSKGLGIWFDVANFYKNGEQVLFKDLETIRDQIHYIHLKDFDRNGNYVPLGEGIINYKRIVSDIKTIFRDKEIYLSIETHVHSDPVQATAKSVATLRRWVSEKRVGYGVVGCGQVFAKHGSAISKNELSELRAIFDIDEQRAKESSLQYDCEVKHDFKSMLDDEQIAVVNIRTPNDTHTNLVLQTIERGKTCLCEKPLCLTSDEADKIVKSKYCNNNVIVNFQNRFNPAVAELFDLLHQNKLGKILLCSIDIRWWRDDAYFNDWHGDRDRVGGMLFNQGAHALDIMHQLCGTIKKVEKISKCLRNKSDVDDIYLALVEFQDGAIGRIEMTTYTKYRNCEAALFIVGEKGSLKLGGPSFNKMEFLSTEEDPQGIESHNGGELEVEDSHYRLINALNKFVLTGEKDERLAMAEDGAIVTRLIEKLYR